MHFRPDWVEPVECETTYSTTISGSASGELEERHSLQRRPARSCAFRILEHGEDALHRMRTLLEENARTFGWRPLAADETHTTSAVAAGEAVIPCDPRYRRFYAGGRAVLVSPDGTVSFDLGIESVGSDHIILATPTPTTLPIHSSVMPAMYCVPSLTSEESVVTDLLSSSTIRNEEKQGPFALPPRNAPFAQMPLFPLVHNWRENVQVNRSPYALSKRSGKAEAFYIASSHSPAEYSISHLVGRIAWWDFLSFFDGVRGRAYPFWFADPVTRWRAVGTSTIRLDIVKGGIPDSIESIVALNPVLQQSVVVPVGSVVGPSLNLASMIPIDLYIHPKTTYVPAIKCRLNMDTLKEDWITNQLVTFELTAREVRNG